MDELFERGMVPAILISQVSTMLSCGLSLTLARLFSQFCNVRLAVPAAPMFGRMSVLRQAEGWSSV